MKKDFYDFPCTDSINITNSYLYISVIKKDKITLVAVQIITGINVNSVFQLLSACILCCCVHIQSAGNSLFSSSNVSIYFITCINCSFHHLVSNIMFITNNRGYQSSQVAYTSTSSGKKNAGFPQNICQLHFETTHTEQTEPQNTSIPSKHHIIQLKNTQKIALY